MDTLRMKRLSVAAAIVLMLMMVLLRGGSALEVSMSFLAACTPDCTGMATGDKVVDPQNCTNFYYCVDGQPAANPNSCVGDSHFDPFILECVAGAECDSVCGRRASGCAITCNEDTVMVANPFDCSTYYFCTPGGPELHECPAEFPYFDGSGCTNDPSVCCSPLYDAYCDGSGLAMLPDPKDCTSFYVCDTEEGPPSDDFHYRCGAGEYFNIALGSCETAEDGFSCTNLCDAALGSTATRDCVFSFTCPAEGFFPACDTCQPEFFECAGAGVDGVINACSDGMVFNPTPDYGFCLLPESCPYP